MWHWLSLGYTPAGVEVWNAIRALDYLETRSEVDRRHIGLTGISGGGAITWYTAAVDERIAAAAPVCSTFTYGSQADHWLASGQCDCIYYHNTYAWDFPIISIDRKSTRLNSSHSQISYAVFCLKKKN